MLLWLHCVLLCLLKQALDGPCLILSHVRSPVPIEVKWIGKQHRAYSAITSGPSRFKNWDSIIQCDEILVQISLLKDNMRVLFALCLVLGERFHGGVSP